MKIGLAVPMYARWFNGAPLLEVMAKAKEVGFDSIWTVDHIILTPDQAQRYGTHTTDLWTSQAYYAGVCDAMDYHPQFAQAVGVIPWRPPIQQAQVLATLDAHTQGRLIIGAGSGHIPEAFAGLGIGFSDRSERTDDYLRCMIQLWRNRVASYHGKYADFDNMTIMVEPVQKPHPPILWGGRGPRPFRRIAEMCQGYLPGGGSTTTRSKSQGTLGEPSRFEGKPTFPWDEDELTGVERVEKDMAEIMKYWERYGRKGKPYLATGMTGMITDDRREAEAGESRYATTHVDDVVASIRAWSDIGVDHFQIRPAAYRVEGKSQLQVLLHQMELLGEYVMPKVPHTRLETPFAYPDP